MRLFSQQTYCRTPRSRHPWLRLFKTRIGSCVTVIRPTRLQRRPQGERTYILQPPEPHRPWLMILTTASFRPSPLRSTQASAYRASESPASSPPSQFAKYARTEASEWRPAFCRCAFNPAPVGSIRRKQQARVAINGQSFIALKCHARLRHSSESWNLPTSPRSPCLRANPVLARADAEARRKERK